METKPDDISSEHPDQVDPPRTVSRTSQLGSKPSKLPSVPGYEILGELGRGGMGVVYKAVQAGLKRPVALKMILAGQYASPDAAARFRAEAKAAAKLHHPNIVQIYHFADDQELPFFALEFVDGGSLDKRLAGRPQSPQTAARLVYILARAIDVAHQKGIIHRDLKPANILLNAEGMPKITDFGLAKLLDEDGRTASGVILGTPGYMAPEQASGRSSLIGPGVDIYALGAMLYEVLTGRPPFRGETLLETLDQLRFEQPIAPRVLRPEIPPDLEAICLRCLAKLPEQRHASAAELAEDLRRFLKGEPLPGTAGTDRYLDPLTTDEAETYKVLLSPSEVRAVVVAGGGWNPVETATAGADTEARPRSRKRRTKPISRWWLVGAAGVGGALSVLVLGWLTERFYGCVGILIVCLVVMLLLSMFRGR